MPQLLAFLAISLAWTASVAVSLHPYEIQGYRWIEHEHRDGTEVEDVFGVVTARKEVGTNIVGFWILGESDDDDATPDAIYVECPPTEIDCSSAQRGATVRVSGVVKSLYVRISLPAWGDAQAFPVPKTGQWWSADRPDLCHRNARHGLSTTGHDLPRAQW